MYSRPFGYRNRMAADLLSIIAVEKCEKKLQFLNSRMHRWYDQIGNHYQTFYVADTYKSDGLILVRYYRDGCSSNQDNVSTRFFLIDRVHIISCCVICENINQHNVSATAVTRCFFPVIIIIDSQISTYERFKIGKHVHVYVKRIIVESYRLTGSMSPRITVDGGTHSPAG